MGRGFGGQIGSWVMMSGLASSLMMLVPLFLIAFGVVYVMGRAEGSRTGVRDPYLGGKVIALHQYDRLSDSYVPVTGGQTLVAGEAYMLGFWTTPDLVSVIRLFSANMRLMQAMDAKGSPLRWRRLLVRWDRSRSPSRLRPGRAVPQASHIR